MLGARPEPGPEGAPIVMELGPGPADALAAIEGVAWVAPARGRRVPLNEASRVAIGVGALQAAPWALEGAAQVAGVWDGGPPNPDHPDLAGRLVYADTSGSAHCADCAHATHVACTIAGSGEGSLAAGGVARQWRGMAPAAALMAYDFYGDLLAEYRAAWRDRGVRASNNSWGYCVDPGDPGCEPCAAFSSYQQDSHDFDALVAGEAPSLLLVFAAGNARNDGICGQETTPPYPNFRTLVPPSTAKNAITVGATDAAGAMSAFSSWGPAGDGRIKPDLVADGVSVLSCADPGVRYTAHVGDLDGDPGRDRRRAAAARAARAGWRRRAAGVGAEGAAGSRGARPRGRSRLRPRPGCGERLGSGGRRGFGHGGERERTGALRGRVGRGADVGGGRSGGEPPRCAQRSRGATPPRRSRPRRSW